MDEHYETVKTECLKGGKVNRTKLAASTGLNDRDIVKMIAIFNKEG